jgi:hypothetical protein
MPDAGGFKSPITKMHNQVDEDESVGEGKITLHPKRLRTDRETNKPHRAKQVQMSVTATDGISHGIAVVSDKGLQTKY